MRDCEAAWRDTRKQLRKDHRYELAEGLEREDKEKLFNTHIEDLARRAKEQFHRLLDEVTDKVRLYTGHQIAQSELDPRHPAQ